jgi:epoxyqueuosine reductase QueG
VKQPDGTIVPGPVCTGKPCGECQRRKKGCLQLAASAYLEINRLRGLGACDAAVTACKAFGKLLEKKKSNQTAAKNAGNTAGDN